MEKKIILITGASSGFGRLSAEALAKAGYTVYASMRDTRGHNAPVVEEMAAHAREAGTDLRTVELDVSSEASVEAAVAKVIADAGRIDVLIHNAEGLPFGPSLCARSARCCWSCHLQHLADLAQSDGPNGKP
jgi:NAD(P)-dependent dehydrogenase (short-subunit alcohol dehydrogenase family)